MTSGPTAVQMVTSATLEIALFGATTMAAVLAPLLFANSRAACVYGVAPLAAHADDKIQFRDLSSLQIHSCLFPIVLRAFPGLGPGSGATRENRLNPFGRSAEGRRAFHGIEHCQPSACSSANVDDTSAGFNSLDGHVHDLGDFRNGRADDACDERIFGIDDLQNAFRREKVDVDGPRITPFSAHV